jgi:hypothetical protein
MEWKVIACLHGVQAAVDLGVMFAVLETDALLVQLAMEREEEDLLVTIA